MAITSVHFIFVSLLYQSLGSSQIITTAEQPICHYPKGSLVCKTWNYTNMDCANRRLECIPHFLEPSFIELLDLHNNFLSEIPDNAFSKLLNLLALNLSHNGISTLHNNSLTALHKLRHLDLSYNKLHAFMDSPYQDLALLLTLNLSENNLRSIKRNTFVGLENLQALDMSGNLITDIGASTFFHLKSLLRLYITFGTRLDGINVPFQELASLQQLNMAIQGNFSTSDCRTFEKLFTNLHTLEHLSINHQSHQSCEYDFCSLSSLQTLDVDAWTNLTDSCLQSVPLTSLRCSGSSCNVNMINDELRNLTELEMNNIMRIGEKAKNVLALSALDSPLYKLSLVLNMLTTLNSTIFKPWAKWNASLQVLELQFVSNVFCERARDQFDPQPCIIGSPFQWFPNLKILRMKGNQNKYSIVLTTDTFNGLPNLRELHIEFLNSNIFQSSALLAFGSSIYPSLEVLNLSNNQLNGYIEDEQICSISSLQMLDLSHNNLIGFNTSQSCTLPNLKMISLRNNTPTHYWFDANWNLTRLCDNTPNLQILDASHLKYDDLLRGNATCLNLLSFNLTHSYGKFYDNDNVPVITVPDLKHLYLQHVVRDPINSQLIGHVSKVMIFKAPKLQTLDLSFNEIIAIDEEEAAFLSSMPLTHLDLSSNEIYGAQDMFFNNMKYLNLSYTYVTATDAATCSPGPCAITHFNNLSNIEILSLRSTAMKFIPRSLLSKSDHPFLHTLEWSGTVVCDCNAQELQTWLLIDKIVYLKNYTNNFDKDTWNKPWNYCCLNSDVYLHPKDGFSLTAVPLDCNSMLWLYIFIGVVGTVLVLPTGFLSLRYCRRVIPVTTLSRRVENPDVLLTTRSASRFFSLVYNAVFN